MKRMPTRPQESKQKYLKIKDAPLVIVKEKMTSSVCLPDGLMTNSTLSPKIDVSKDSWCALTKVNSDG